MWPHEWGAVCLRLNGSSILVTFLRPFPRSLSISAFIDSWCVRPEGTIVILLSDLLHNKTIIMISSVLKVFRSHHAIPWLLKNYTLQDFFLFFFFSFLNYSISGASTSDRLFKTYCRTLFTPTDNQPRCSFS